MNCPKCGADRSYIEIKTVPSVGKKKLVTDIECKFCFYSASGEIFVKEICDLPKKENIHASRIEVIDRFVNENVVSSDSEDPIGNGVAWKRYFNCFGEVLSEHYITEGCCNEKFKETVDKHREGLKGTNNETN